MAVELSELQRKKLNDQLAIELAYRERLDRFYGEEADRQKILTAMEAEKKKSDVANDAVATHKAAFSTGISEGARNFVKSVGDDAANAQKLTQTFLDGTSKAIDDLVTKGKANFRDLWTSMAEQFLQQEIKMGLSGLISGGTGGGSTGAGIWSLVTSVGSWFSHAGGLDYVPYDGYKATLHEGEAVVPKAQNTSNAGGAVHFDFSGQTINVGQGVSRAEVYAAVNQSNQQVIAHVTRLSRTGKLQT